MTFHLHVLKLRGDTPGLTAELPFYRIGPPDAPEKVYLQAALHADEQPGTMLLHHLLPMLREADEQELLRARFTVIPMANPLGMANLVQHKHLGRTDLDTGVNYNRQWPDLFAMVRTQLSGRLGDDERFNVTLIRKTVAQWIDSQQPRTAAEQLRLILLKEAHDAEFVLDLHCDSDSLLHIFTSPELMPELEDLAEWMGAAAVLTAADSGGGSFDEVLPLLYRKLAQSNPGKPIPLASATATLEYRGLADSFDHFGEQDALRLFGFFAGRDLIAADPGPRPEPMGLTAPFEATDIVRAPAAGLLAYRVDLGQRVHKGQPVADLIALDGPEAFLARTPLVAGTDGLVLSRTLRKYVARGEAVAKIVGTAPLPQRRGYLLED
ncbi:MAG: succinylglutamate desuccinylase [Devosia sp. 67-54]|uniref:M14 family zinc carboxypeptidase n=1 Tax=unclassified Devosia TaxID=196773 RepID=UPI0009648812|nr:MULTISPECIES: succinylglutamate desuccinylase/aspartoacylase family protein [unclassified Devosia]MBN9307637.1 succinylglutamate desuccinylase/aspartoacylase family protein [Devosia sp.]OJX17443.1 MAG: succinylglutamate desuccinylase [Devosia sp. 67-54]